MKFYLQMFADCLASLGDAKPDTHAGTTTPHRENVNSSSMEAVGGMGTDLELKWIVKDSVYQAQKVIRFLQVKNLTLIIFSTQLGIKPQSLG